MNTIGEILNESTKQLKAQNNPSSRLDAEVLLAHLLKADRSYLIINSQEELDETILLHYQTLVGRRLKGEPVAYIIGHQEFMGLDFMVNEHVLIPRPDTERLVEYLIRYLKRNKDRTKVLDIGTGSGAIGLSIGKNIPYTNLTLVDISQEALEVAKINAQRLGICKPVTYLLSDCFKGVKKQSFDIIVSNPPYIPTSEITGLQREVRSYEPRNALDGGEDGLFFYRKIINEARPYLTKGGLIAFEIGYNQADDIMKLLDSNGYGRIEKFKDYAGKDRVVVGTSLDTG